ncbi:MAG TPA: hypothetical protein VFW98_17975 [Gemmatimonadaceae bacterium]|nr:hypothetical protein [Gemmatimonadaceae bacterium]
MASHTRNIVMLVSQAALLAAVAGCGSDRVAGPAVTHSPSSVVRTSIASNDGGSSVQVLGGRTYSGPKALAGVIARLEAIASDSLRRGLYAAGSTTGPMTIEQEIAQLENLQTVETSSSTRTESGVEPRVGDCLQGFCYVFGSTMIYADTTPPAERTITFHAYTNCEGCDAWQTTVGGDMTMHVTGGGTTWPYYYHYEQSGVVWTNGEFSVNAWGDALSANCQTIHTATDNGVELTPVESLAYENSI